MKIKNYLQYLLVTVIFINSFLNISGQIYINEFMASNSSLINDPDFEDDPDWIELYNAGNNSVNLQYFCITDNLNDPVKWRISIDTVIQPKNYIIIWADGKDTLLHTNFNLSRIGEEIGIYNAQVVFQDKIVYSEQKPNVSFGRNVNNFSKWGYFENPTPGFDNYSDFFADYVSNVPEFSVKGGIFSSPFTVQLINKMGGTIRYTLDGAEPEASSNIYNSPITVNNTTIIRARIFKENQIAGPVITHTYFYDDVIKDIKLPIFSMVTDSDNFWDTEKGIYVQSFKPEWEIPVNIELFENNGSDRAAFNTRAGVKVNGLYSWRLPQKMLGVYFRKSYGGKLDYPLIFESQRKVYGSFALRASGNDWSNTMFKDGMLQQSTQYNMNNDIQGYRPSVLFVNGEYMGINNMREKVDNDYIESIYNLEPGTYDLVENENFAEEGNLDAYKYFLNLTKKDLSVEVNYNTVANLMDIENFTDYVVNEIYSRNSSLNHNVMAWKPKDGGKWKWIIMDLDRGMNGSQTDLIDFFLNIDQIPFKELFKNESYKQYFGRRLADHLYTTFHPEQMIKNIDKYRELIIDEMPRHIKRWEGTTSSYGNAIPSMDFWESEIEVLRQYAIERPQILLDDLTNYGFDGTNNLNLLVYPVNAGKLKINGLKVPASPWHGPYLKNIEITLTADNNPGYRFIGWSRPIIKEVFSKNSSWKYLDDGSDQGTQWKEESFNDTGWKTGNGELGYGDGGENTTIEFGSDANNKYITYYFRHKFSVTSQDLNSGEFFINLVCDDGAIVYLNGNEILRYNMGNGNIDYSTLATTAIGEDKESEYISFNFDNSNLKEGENTLAVEVHQSEVNSTDISFDLELICNKVNFTAFSASNEFKTTLTSDDNLIAVFESTGECMLPDIISENTVISKSCSPVLINNDVIIRKGVTLSIEPGVIVYMAQNTNVYINGVLEAKGSENERIRFVLNPQFENEKWGSLIFNNPEDTSKLSFVTIEDASEGPIPINQMAAISSFYANLKLDNLLIEKVYSNPIAARYSDITLLNSSLHSEVTGDLINVKYGKARIENCVFRGNDKIDSDAIDYDDVNGGIVKNCKIYNLLGFNNDAIDIGEKSKNIQIDSVLAYNIVDKGVSFGQQSTGTVKNCIFANCNLGLGLKDSCKVWVDHCNFYNVLVPVACYEKNIGSAGGNGIVTNSILSNSPGSSYSADEKSTLVIKNCLSDIDTLPDGFSNIYGNPEFIDPTHYNFKYKSTSICKDNADGVNGLTNIGSYFNGFDGNPFILINKINYNPSKNTEFPEFFSIINPDTLSVDISGYQFVFGVEFTFPEGTIINSGEEIYMVQYEGFPGQTHLNGRRFGWTRGRLADEGEIIQLVDKNGLIIDKVVYKNNEHWHNTDLYTGSILTLKSINLDNHFAENWETVKLEDILEVENIISSKGIIIYPNPSTGKIQIKLNSENTDDIEIYSVTGTLLDKKIIKNRLNMELDLSVYNEKLLLIKAGSYVSKVVILK